MIYEEQNEILIFKGDKIMEFVSEGHEERYNKFIEMDNTSNDDNERKSFFYIISGNYELSCQINKIYDFKGNKIILDNYIDGKLILTGGTSRMIYLAHHFYNGFNFGKMNKDMADRDLSLLDIFSVFDINGYNICTNALNIRFGKMK